MPFAGMACAVMPGHRDEKAAWSGGLAVDRDHHAQPPITGQCGVAMEATLVVFWWERGAALEPFQQRGSCSELYGAFVAPGGS